MYNRQGLEWYVYIDGDDNGFPVIDVVNNSVRNVNTDITNRFSLHFVAEDRRDTYYHSLAFNCYVPMVSKLVLCHVLETYGNDKREEKLVKTKRVRPPKGSVGIITYTLFRSPSLKHLKAIN